LGGASISAHGGAPISPKGQLLLFWVVVEFLGIIYVIFCVEIVELGLCRFDMVIGVGVVVIIVCGVIVWIWVCVGLIWLPKFELWW
jgi:hypothetical protein